MNSTLCLPQLKFEILFSGLTNDSKVGLVVAGGRKPSNEWFKQLSIINNFSNIYCADKGLIYCLENKMIPNFLFGDADSAGEEAFEKARQSGVFVKRYPVEKDDTDLQILLHEMSDDKNIITGIFGGRLDHLYSNIFSILAHVEKKNSIAIMADEKEVLLIMQSKMSAKIEINQDFSDNLEAISLLPLSEQAEVSLKGVHWPLEKSVLELKRPYAISNRLENFNKIECECIKGNIGLYFCFEKN